MSAEIKPWLKLSAPYYCDEGIDAVVEYLDTAPGNLTPEAPRAQFETELAAYLGVPAPWVLATNSCTAALSIACECLDQGRGIEAPALTWPATYAHARERVLVDASQGDPPAPQWSEVPGRVRVAVALWGRRAPLPPRDRGPIIVDAAHAFGAHLDDLRERRVDAVCYSFGPLKEVPCSRGGALVSPHCADAMWRAAVDSGTRGRHAIYGWGGNYEMGEPECVLGLKQLAHPAAWAAQRRGVLRAYAANWSERGAAYNGRLLTLPDEASGHLCVALANTAQVRLQWMSALLASRIQCGIHYELPLWLPATQFPVAWEWSQRILSLPLHLGVTEEDVARVVALLASV